MANGISPDLMNLMQGGGAAAGMGQMPPVSSPMATPQPNEGEKNGAMVQVQMAMDLLERTIPSFGSESDEGQSVLSALKSLGSRFGSKREKGRDLIPSEIMNLVASLPKSAQGGAMPPGMPPGGGMPGAMPQQPMM